MIYDLLKINGYDVKICDDPDYLVCDASYEKPFEYCGKAPVRIMYSGENFIPDFNLIDYAISPYPIVSDDRHFRLSPACGPSSTVSHRSTRTGTILRIF